MLELVIYSFHETSDIAGQTRSAREARAGARGLEYSVGKGFGVGGHDEDRAVDQIHPTAAEPGGSHDHPNASRKAGGTRDEIFDQAARAVAFKAVPS